MTESQIALRVYGGHVFIGGGTLQFIDCMFWDFELLIPFTDRLRIGGDVLVRAGVCVCCQCCWFVVVPSKSLFVLHYALTDT